MEQREELVPGRITVEPSVLETIASLTAQNVDGVARIAQKSDVERFLGIGHKSVEVHVEDEHVLVELHLLAQPDISLLRLGKAVQREVTEAVQQMIGMPVDAVNVYIEDILFPKNGAKAGQEA